MHRLPKLKELNVVFILQGKCFNDSINLNDRLILKRCKDCHIKNRVITYSVHQKLYHMFFSSEEYTEPDVVAVYGNTEEMSTDGDDDINSKISYKNMTYSKNTVLVLMDEDNDLLRQGVRAVHAARPVDLLVSPQVNKLRGFSSNRAVIDSIIPIINDKHSFTCLRRK